MQGLAKSAIVAFLSGAKEKYGYWEMREGSFLVSKGLVGAHKYDHVIERYLDTVRALGGHVDDLVFPLPDITIEKSDWRRRLASDGLKGLTLLSFPVRWDVKEWPLDTGAAF